ncbi:MULTISPECIES: hypothetical protein [unclassified Paenibacillus]|uniref:hypothetical protein n=1 Tax=unclassified Paenibacillus TaxID=185978 RepID=UPI001AE3B172|nr:MULTISPECIES: hypothetical protein [unclassified Paenibacillus]MBP1154332.1 hypothetical protein [Paenibacillus sp. PvP091]MBP1170284.1 hypothetical protein [Paenibacillus sp. PvR098]MBP2441312.1 hypothetical protein [Paenibacillus sp. PvP052]
MPEVTGSVNAEFTSEGGITQLRSHTQSYPLKIAKTFPFEGHQLGVYQAASSFWRWHVQVISNSSLPQIIV